METYTNLHFQLTQGSDVRKDTGVQVVTISDLEDDWVQDIVR